MDKVNDKIFLSKNFRFIVQQNIGIEKILCQIRKDFNVKTFRENGEIIILVEQKYLADLIPKTDSKIHGT